MFYFDIFLIYWVVENVLHQKYFVSVATLIFILLTRLFSTFKYSPNTIITSQDVHEQKTFTTTEPGPNDDTIYKRQKETHKSVFYNLIYHKI